MTRSRSVFLVLSMGLMAAILVGNLALAADGDESEDQSLFKYLSVFTEVLNLVRQAYVEPAPSETLFAGALDGTADALDPFSTYVPADSVGRYLAIREISDRHSGLTVAKERGIAYVVAVTEGSPAVDLDIESGDIVAQINGLSTRDMPLWEIQALLAGEPGSVVELEILRRGESSERSLELVPFDPPPPHREDVDGAAVLRLAAFDSGTEEQVRAILREMTEAGQDRLLLDLRGVAGEECEVAYRVGALFAAGSLGELQGKGGVLDSFESDASPVWEGSLVVLVDRGSVGSPEVLTEVLRTAVGAEVVGQRTFGYAGRSDLVELSDGSRLLLTDGFYTGPSGKPITERGLEPDITVDERSRAFDEEEVPLDELIYRRGLDRLLELADEPMEKAA